MRAERAAPSATAARLAAAVSLAAATCLTAAACSPRAPDATPPAADAARDLTLTAAQRQHIRLYTVEPAAFRASIETTGVVDFDNDQATTVLAPFSGPVTRLLVSAGDKVRKGQALATVDSPDFAAALGAWQKALATARTDRKLADADKDLAAHQGVSAREALQAQTDAANAEADVRAAGQALAALGADPRAPGGLGGAGGPPGPSRTPAVIRAPIAGTVAERLITPGQFLQGGTTPSFTVADLSRVWVLAQIPDSDLAAVKRGAPARVDTPAGTAPLAGTVTNIADVVSPDTRTVQARVVVANPDGLLRKQMYVRVTLDAGRGASGLLAPVSAILRDDENLPLVYVARPDGGFARRHVTLGQRTGDSFVVTDGLAPGDRVVADGAIFLQFMQTQ